jgi:hypothetical protein
MKRVIGGDRFLRKALAVVDKAQSLLDRLGIDISDFIWQNETVV